MRFAFVTCGFSLRISRQRFASPKTRAEISESVSPLLTTYISRPGRCGAGAAITTAADKVSIANPTTTAPIPIVALFIARVPRSRGAGGLTDYGCFQRSSFSLAFAASSDCP